jgi:hypothetical protein
MSQASQRVDIAKVVADFLAQRSPSDVEDIYESARPAGPIEAPCATPLEPVPSPRRRPEPAAGGTQWYVVIDEIVETTVTFEAWPWPTIDPATRFLSFDLAKTKRKTVGRAGLQELVDQRRRQHDTSAAADRPLRIGDVFQVAAKNVRNPRTWTSVIDDTRRQRKAAQAALNAMAAPPHLARIDELESVGSQLEEATATGEDRPNRAFPAI